MGRMDIERCGDGVGWDGVSVLVVEIVEGVDKLFDGTGGVLAYGLPSAATTRACDDPCVFEFDEFFADGAVIGIELDADGLG